VSIEERKGEAADRSSEERLGGASSETYQQPKAYKGPGVFQSVAKSADAKVSPRFLFLV